MQEYEEVFREILGTIFVISSFATYALAGYFSLEKEQRKLLKEKNNLESFLEDYHKH